jgi:hypothetical protein
MKLIYVIALLASLCLVAIAQPAADEGPTPEWIDDGSNEDLLAKYNAMKEAYAAAKGSGADGKTLLYFLLLAACANLLISGIKRAMQLTNKGKKYLPWIAAGLGVVAGFASYYGLGVGLLAAVIYGAGPPAAIIFQELFKPADKLLSAIAP